MKNVSLLFFVFVVVIGCKSSDDDFDCCTIIDTGSSIKYLNDEGGNLFEIENGYDLSTIKVLWKKDGEWIGANNGSDNPRGISVIEREGVKYLEISPSYHLDAHNISETKIRFSTDDEDILKTKVDTGHGNSIATKVWYNDELKWEQESQTERIFEVVK